MLNIETAPLGVLPDPVIAEQVGQHRRSPAERRKRRGIPASTGGRTFERLCQWVRETSAEGIVDWYVCVANHVTHSVARLAIEAEKPDVWPEIAASMDSIRECLWVDWDMQPLGRVTDSLLAERLGVAVHAVAAARIERSIQAMPEVVDWSAQPLGDEPDARIAARLGVSVSTVAHHRNAMGIRPHCPIDWDRQPLGEVHDKDLAASLGVTVATVRAHRKKRGIGRYSEIDWDAQPLGQMADTEIAEMLGTSVYAVGKQRAKRGIRPYRAEHDSGIDWGAQPLGKEPVLVTAKRLGVSTTTVYKYMKRLGIKPNRKRFGGGADVD